MTSYPKIANLQKTKTVNQNIANGGTSSMSAHHGAGGLLVIISSLKSHAMLKLRSKHYLAVGTMVSVSEADGTTKIYTKMGKKTAHKMRT